jgi:hypothetical protein
LDKLPKGCNIDMGFWTWNFRSLYRAGSLVTVSKELSKYKLDLLGVYEVRWESGSVQLAGEYTYLGVNKISLTCKVISFCGSTLTSK